MLCSFCTIISLVMMVCCGSTTLDPSVGQSTVPSFNSTDVWSSTDIGNLTTEGNPILSLPFVTCHVPTGKHCAGIEMEGPFLCLIQPILDPLYYINEEFMECYPCFTPSSCLPNNICAEGTAGPSCERCARGDSISSTYYPVGITCVQCDSAPWPVFVFLALVALMLANIFLQGFKLSLAIKLRQICTCTQLMFLTLSVKKLWSDEVLNILKYFSFVSGSVESFFMIGCYTDIPIGLHQLQWLFVISILVLFLGGAFGVDRYMAKFIKYDPDEERVHAMWARRMMLRRFVFLFLCMWYAPLVSATAKSFSCAFIIKGFSHPDKDVYLYDHSDKFTCEHFLHQFINMILTLLVLFGCICGPFLIIFAGLVAYKWDTLHANFVLSGSYYESYKPRFAFWEAFPLLLRLIYIGSTDIYPTYPEVSLLCMFIFTLLYLLAVIICKPYKKIKWTNDWEVDIHNILEVLCMVGILLFQLVNVLECFVDSDSVPWNELQLTAISFLLIVLIIGVVLYYMVLLEKPMIDFESLDLPQYTIQQQSTHQFWMRDKLGGGVDAMEMVTRRRELDF